jgi:hypothetical protein
MSNISIDHNKLRKEVIKRLWDVGNDLTNLMTSRVPVDTGLLKNSIRYTITNNGDIVFYMNEYATHVEYGTKPHKIRVKNKQVLSDGKRIFGKEVQHPGTTAQPFIRPSIHQLTRILKERLDGVEVTVKVSE